MLLTYFLPKFRTYRRNIAKNKEFCYVLRSSKLGKHGMVINVYVACASSETELTRIHPFNTLFCETMRLQNLYFSSGDMFSY